MNLFNIGPGEFFLILIIALLVFGPQRLPEVGRKLGKALRDLKSFVSNIDPELIAEFREITADLDTVRAEVASLRDDMVGIQRDITEATQGAVGDIHEALKEMQESSDPAVLLDPNSPLPGASPASREAAAPVATPAPQGSSPLPAAAPASASFVLSSARAGGVDLTDEIIGTLLDGSGDGQGPYADEILGSRLFLVTPRRARSASANGHKAPPPAAERGAFFRPAARPATTLRPAVRPRPVVPSRQAARALPSPRRMRVG